MKTAKREIRRVLLIPAHMEPHGRALPLGLAYMAGYLESKGYKVRVYDPPPYQKPHLMETVRGFRPDVVGISCMTPSFLNACKMAKEIKDYDSGIPIVFGGIHPSSLPEETLKNEFIDFVMVGEGELTFGELVKALSGKIDFADVPGLGYKHEGRVRLNPPGQLIEDIDSLPLPARHLFPRWYFQRHHAIRGHWLRATNLMGSRGCPFNCTYCASKVMFGRRVRFNSPERVVDEIEQIVRDYKLDGVTFSDDTFSINRERVIRICRLIRERGLRIKFRVQMRVDTVTEDVARALREAGCLQADLGVESGSPRILKVLNKGTSPEQAVEAFRILKKHGIKTCATFMIGNPTETRQDVEMTRQLAHRLNADYTQFFITIPYPGTPMYCDIVKSNPKIRGISYESYHHGGTDLKSFVECEIPEEELIELQKSLNEEFLSKTGLKMMRNRWLWVDMVSLLIQKPRILARALGAFVRTGKITEMYRVFYYSQNLRR